MAKDILTTDEIKSKLLLSTNGERNIALHVAALKGTPD
jgi:hypothetical protein